VIGTPVVATGSVVEGEAPPQAASPTSNGHTRRVRLNMKKHPPAWRMKVLSAGSL